MMNLDALLGEQIDPMDHVYTKKDSILYALGLGYGSDPSDPEQLAYVYEEGLKAVPSLCVVLAHPGFWLRKPELDVNWLRLLHAEQGFKIHRPLPSEGTVRGSYRIVAVEDRGTEKGSVIYQEKLLHDGETNDLIATVMTTLFLRGDSGQGGYGTPPPQMSALAGTAPDQIIEVPTLPQQALIYRLSGDWNPIHASLEAAAVAGFDRPILQGLCTMGIAVRAVLAVFCNDQPERLLSFSVRFTKPVFPGETLKFEFFREGDDIRFRAHVIERNIIVLDRCTATVA